MTPELKVKVCGLTRRSDIELIAELGADYFGCIVPQVASLPRRWIVAPLFSGCTRGHVGWPWM